LLYTETTDLTTAPLNFSISQNEFEISAKPYWNYLDRNVEKDPERYLRVVYGIETIEWLDGQGVFSQNDMDIKRCGDDGFVLRNDQQDQFRMEEAICPDYSENIHING
jgi:hypothetical protein